MPTLTDLFKSLCTKAGIDPAETIAAIEKNEAVKSFNVPDAAFTALDQKLFTFEQAKHNADLKNHFVGQQFSTINSRIAEIMREEELDPDTIMRISETPSSFDKFKMVGAAIKSKEAQKVAAASGDKKNLQVEIDKLNAQILAERNSAKEKLEAETNRFLSEKKDMILRGKLSGFNYSKQIDRTIAEEAAFIGLQKKLAEQGGKIVMEDGVLKLVNASDPQLKFHINNVEQKLEDYVEKYMADSKLIQVNAPEPPQTPGAGVGNGYTAPAVEGHKPLPAAASQIKQIMKDMGVVQN